jgi:uncharacterized protein
MDRRTFLTRTAAAGALALGDTLLPRALAGAATASSMPYGPLLAPNEHGILLPKGFRSRVIAETGKPVGDTGYVWHRWPDGGACFAADRGGWVYVSNSEVEPDGGVSAVRFSQSGDIEAAYRILVGTRRNCAGGVTPWNTWLSCEEVPNGNVWECDPLHPSQGVRRPNLGTFNHEAAAIDPRTGHVYLTEDDPNGRLYRFVPDRPGDRAGLDSGALFAAHLEGNVLTWVPTSPTAPDRSPSTTGFNGGEGLWVDGDALYMTTKGDVRVWRMNLRSQRMGVIYESKTTPDGALNAVDNATVHRPSGDVFVAEDGGTMDLCILSRIRGDVVVAPFLRIVGQDSSEVTGPAFSPDGTRLYVSSQRGTDNATGVTYEITGPFRQMRSKQRRHP